MPVALLNVESFWAEMRSAIVSVVLRTKRDAEIPFTLNCKRLLQKAAQSCTNMCILIPVKGTSSANEMPDSQSPDSPLMMSSLSLGDSGDKSHAESKPRSHAFTTFCETTTFHGLRNVAESSSNVTRK